MTAEIAILNKTGVALAADSKVTLSRGGKQKTFDTVDKLFSISNTEPIGAMIYGNAEFMGFPWETEIIPFAQTDMVYRFMEGIDPDYAVQLHESFGDLLFKNAADTAIALGHNAAEVEAITPALMAATAAAVDAFWKSNERIRRERFASPIIDMTMSLPKDELANLAESLVSLTSLQRRVSREIETVGGAIDVAVISKGDGFVWIKRKHYFEADRNLRFMNSYYAEFARAGEVGNGNEHA